MAQAGHVEGAVDRGQGYRGGGGGRERERERERERGGVVEGGDGCVCSRKARPSLECKSCIAIPPVYIYTQKT